ncbi:NADP-dependent oxidoreductase [Nocardiopsis ganjiahuensis]|uniref:NADP-dependent oxidoreductase n=1 Tax=Nocardiopsis ganjiahuensis TaxID=239984 RepID=UPI0004760132|nr:NADP-dependent oxidoreductase [Nocardiopsis ganjiahuensis]
MKAAAFQEFGEPEVLRETELPTPDAAPGEVRVRVLAAGVQPIDCAIRSGRRRPPGLEIVFPHVTGGEFAGVVDAVGQGVTDFRVGDQVLGFRTQWTYAQYTVVPTDQIVAKPASMPWDVAGGLSGAGQAAHTAVGALKVAAGETFLINGAAGGVGTIAVQLARRCGATVIGTASEANHDYLRSLGAIPVTYGDGLADRIRDVAPNGVDAALDAANEAGLKAALDLVQDPDRVGTIAAPEAAKKLGALWIGSQRSTERLTDLVNLYTEGGLRILVRATYPLARAAEAHRNVESGHGRGKVVLTLD